MGESNRLPLAVISFFLPLSLIAQGRVTGTVTTSEGEAIHNANVFIHGIMIGAATDRDGHYTIVDCPAGSHTLIVGALGYRTGQTEINMPKRGEVTQDFSLAGDPIRLDEIIATAVRNPLSKIESSVAITTLSEMDIRRIEPQSTADLLSNVPGFYVESSGGQVGGNLFARGLPADGSFRYVSLMEDGMPVYDETELYFVNADIFVRIDENIERVEAVRGGNSALFGHNNPGGVINFISKTGGPVRAASLRATGGTGGLIRADFNINGPYGDAWRYNIGGFYRFDDGLRKSGIPVSNGFQVKGNVTRLLGNGYVRVYGKYLNDRNTFYLGLPVIGESRSGGSRFVLTDDFVVGFPANGSLTTKEGNNLEAPIPGGSFTMPLEDGQKQVGGSIIADVNLDLGAFKLRNMTRIMSFDHTWNAILPFSISETSDTSVAKNPTYADGGAAVAEKYLASSGLWHVGMPLTNISNQFQLQRSLDLGIITNALTLGAYFGRHTQDSFWFWHDIITTVPDEDGEFAKLVNVTGSDNGVTRYGSNYLDAEGKVTTLAFFFGDDIAISEALRVDIGVRYETNDLDNTTKNTGTYDLGDANTTADDAVLWDTTGTTDSEAHFNNVAYSFGANYLLSDGLSIYGRYSSGYKTPMASQIMWSKGDVTADTLGEKDRLQAETLNQAEVGVKLGTPTYGINATGYLLKLGNFPSSDARVVDGETVFIIDYVGKAQTIGVEVDAVAKLGPFDLNSTFTFQNHKYVKFFEGEADHSGHWVRRIPQIILNIGATYDIAGFVLGGNLNFIGKRYANTANDIELPSFMVVNLSAVYAISDNLSVKVAVFNTLDARGLTEGNPRTDETGTYETGPVLARPILPRRIQASLSLNF